MDWKKSVLFMMARRCFCVAFVVSFLFIGEACGSEPIEAPFTWAHTLCTEVGACHKLTVPTLVGHSDFEVKYESACDSVILKNGDMTWVCDVLSLPQQGFGTLMHLNFVPTKKGLENFYLNVGLGLNWSDDEGRVTFPNKSVLYPIQGIKRCDISCEYSVQKDCCIITRFFYEYTDKRKIFVRACIYYANFNKVELSIGQRWPNNGRGLSPEVDLYTGTEIM